MSSITTTQLDHARENDRARHVPTAAERSGVALYWSFIACLVVVSLPVKNLAYLAPVVYLALQYWAGNFRLLVRLSVLTGIMVMISLLSVVWDSLRLQDTNLPGIAMGVLTHLPLLILLCEKFNRRIDAALFHRFVNVCCWFVIIQSAIGLAQFAVFGNPDTVCGTYGLLDGMQETITIAQVYFTFTIFGMLLFMLPDLRRPLVATSFIIGLVACAAAQSGHQTIFLAVALCACGVFGIFRPKVIMLSGTLVVAMAVFVVMFYPQTYFLTREWYRKVVTDPDSPKRIVIDGGLNALGDAKNALLGVGMGQYCSRAAMITSNTYLSVKLPGAMSGQSDYFRDYVLPGQAIFEHSGEGSAISKPYFSLLSLLVELGVLQVIALCCAVAVAMRRNFALSRSRLKDISLIGFGANVGIAFLLMCCIVENYVEFPQAIVLPFLLYVVALSYAQTRLSETQQPTPRE